MPDPVPSVLLVEDEADHAAFIRRAFDTAAENGERFRLTVAETVGAARELVERERPDLILADLLLPDGRGTDLLPADGGPAPWPLVVLTSHGDERRAVEAMKAGALDYVVKSPRILDEIPRVAERALREWRHVTERRRAEEERRQMELRLQHSQRLESLGILASGVAHDFNNLVMTILSHTRLGAAQLPEESPVRDHLADVEAAAVHASELCRQLLAYSGRKKFVFEQIDLNRLAREMSHLLGAAISKRASLELELADRLPAIEGAAGQIRQIVMNLIINASDALGGGRGTIAVRTGKVPEAPEGVEAGPCVYLEVADSGCGMDRETRERLFDPFFTTKSTGRGLGMAAVRGIVHGHRGAIEVDSEPGRGTTFRVLFPASPEPLPEADPGGGDAGADEKPPTEPTGGRPPDDEPAAGDDTDEEPATVLVVDDDVTIRAVTAIALEGAGYPVCAAADGREALDVFERRRREIGVVLLDVTMPELEGDETFRELERLGVEVPVIVSSGCAEEEARRRVPGLAGFLPKPYRAEELIAAVRRAMRQ